MQNATGAISSSLKNKPGKRFKQKECMTSAMTVAESKFLPLHTGLHPESVALN